MGRGGENTAFCAGKFRGSVTWSLEILIGRESSAMRNCLAKVSSDMLCY